MSKELQVALAFAKLEILELEAGRRSLVHCPGIDTVAKAIADAKAKAAANVDAFNRTYDANARRRGQYES